MKERKTDLQLNEKQINNNIAKFDKILKDKPVSWNKNIGLYNNFSKEPSKAVRWNFLDELAKGVERNITFAHFFRFSYVRHFTRGGRFNNCNKTILDLGCGKASLRKIMYHNSINMKYIGIDISKSPLEEALNLKSKEPAIYLNYDLNNGIPLVDNSADVIVCFEIIEHIGKNKGINLLKECYRVLKKDGVLFLSTPNTKYAENIYTKDHVYEWSDEEIEKELKKLNFIIKMKRGCSIKTKHLKSMLEKDLEMKNLYDRFSKHFEGSILNQFFSTIYPEKSYDIMWEIEK